MRHATNSRWAAATPPAIAIAMAIAIAIAIAAVIFAAPILAQVPAQVPAHADADAVPSAPSSPPTGEASETSIDIAEAEAQLEEIAADSNLGDAVKATLTAKVEQAISLLEVAQDYRDRTAEFRYAIKQAPIDTAKALRQREALLATANTSGSTALTNADAIIPAIDAGESELRSLEEQLADNTSDLAKARNRPVENATRLPAARLELDSVEAKIASLPTSGDDTPLESADRLLLQAQHDALATEIDMMVAESASQAVRVDMLSARHDLLVIEVSAARTSLEGLQEQANRQASNEADRLTRRVEDLQKIASAGDENIQALGNEVEDLSRKLLESVSTFSSAVQKQKELTTQLSELNGDFDRITEEVNLGGLDGAFVEVLVEQRNQLPNPREFNRSISKRQSKIRDIRLSGFRVDEKLRDQVDMEAQFAANPQKGATDLLTLRQELLEKLRTHNRSLVRALAQVDTIERTYRDKVATFRSYLYENLFWKKSSPPISAAYLVTNLPGSLDWAFSWTRLSEIARALKSLASRHSLLSLLVLLAAALLLTGRRKTCQMIVDAGERTRFISTDRYAHTLTALLGTLLLSLPVPLIVGYVGWGFSNDPQGSDWLMGLGRGLVWSSLIIGAIWFLAATCKPGGLGMAHFGWQKAATSPLLRCLCLLAIVYIPPLLVFSSMLYEDRSLHFDGLGRLLFIAAHSGVALIVWRYFHPSTGTFSAIIRDYPKRAISRFHFAWYSVLVLSPLVLIVLACLGYMITALALSLEALGILALIAAGTILYSLAQRWFMIKERKLALEAALKERKARHEATPGEEESADGGFTIDVEETELDLTSVGAQTRRLLRSVFGVSVTIAAWFLLSTTLPLSGIFGQAAVRGELGLLDVAQAILIAVVFSIVVRNLPGLMELGGLRSTSMEIGVRYAITSISQYIVTAIGLLLLFQTLKVDWSTFGWIATALSVGLGFGLQEIVANFVCGIILLFERPIRVGDIVTVNEVTGRVTRIRMRATTITDWDRKEFLVPNKQFITDTLKNWTLTNSISRILLPIGIAYGSNTEQARQILMDVAHDHPLILDEPPPSAAFEAFADSTLNLTLRCFLAELDFRVKTISELNTEIDKRFKEAGIEIAFPQQDLHIRSVSPEASQGFSGKTE